MEKKIGPLTLKQGKHSDFIEFFRGEDYIGYSIMKSVFKQSPKRCYEDVLGQLLLRGELEVNELPEVLNDFEKAGGFEKVISEF